MFFRQMQLFLYSQLLVDDAHAALAAAQETMTVAEGTLLNANCIAQNANKSCFYAEVHSFNFNHDF